MNARRRVTPGALTAALLGLSCALATSALIARQQALADEGPSTLSNAEFAGEIRPSRETTVTAPTAVLITKVQTVIGARVTEGQVLMEVDDSEARSAVSACELAVAAIAQRVAHLRSAATSLEQSMARLASSLTDANRRLVVAQQEMAQMPVRQWKDSPERASASYEQAVAHHRRIEELWRKGLVAMRELDDAAIAMRIAQNDRDVAQQAAAGAARLGRTQQEQARLQAELALLEQRREQATRVADLRSAEFELARANAALALAKRQLEGTVIRATAPGTVVELRARPGDRLPEGSVLVRTAQLDRLVALIDVPARLVNGIEEGRAVQVSLGAQPSALDGQVRSVAPLPDALGTHVVEVEFRNPKRLLLVSQIARVRFQ